MLGREGTQPSPAEAQTRVPSRHSLADDVVGLFSGTVLAGLGVYLLDHAGLITGQTAGAAFILARATGLDFAIIYFLINLPFYWIAWSRMGVVFTVRTMIAVGGLSLFMYLAPQFLPLGEVHPVVTVVVASIAIGMGLLALVRHRSSLGGGGILAYYIQEAYGVQAGWTHGYRRSHICGRTDVDRAGIGADFFSRRRCLERFPRP